MKATTVTCLFVTRDGGLCVKLLESPIPPTWEEQPIPPGILHAVKLLGMQPVHGRSFKRTCDGHIPVFEEV